MYRLDVGGGRNIDLKECPRCKLKKQCVTYLGPVSSQDTSDSMYNEFI